MLIAFPSQKGFTAFRKPHVGSWYMNALVDILSKHAKDTDLCSMLNMVNGCVSREVTNKGKKQTAEYKSSFTRKAFYFFPGKTQKSNFVERKKMNFVVRRFNRKSSCADRLL